MDIPENQRSILQNKAMHKYFTLLSEKFNESGLDMRVVLKPSIEIPWTPTSVKEFLWRPVQLAMLDKYSTKELDTKEIDKVYNTLNRFIGEKHKFYIPFPSVEEMLIRKIFNNN